VTDSWERVVQAPEGSVPALGRREWELRERVAELESEVAERIERERIRELELGSQRRELEVRFAYNAALEQRVLEHQQQIEWLHGQFERQHQGNVAEQQRVAEENQRVVDQLTAERERLGEALTLERERVAEHQRAVEWFQHERDEVRRELDAERRRLSYRLVQRATTWVNRHRFLKGVLRRFARLAGGSS
jgi:chromosome segregation ATPase